MRSTAYVLTLLTTLTLTSANPSPDPFAFADPAAKTPTYTLPSTTFPNGALNPFYPCSTTPSTCPYRCYTLPSTNLTLTPPTLDNTCYSASSAAALIATNTHICVKCTKPLAREIPTSSAQALPCQPVNTYFSAVNKSSPEPARCGTPSHVLRNCTWDCGAAQVPFQICDRRNTTGMYRFCTKCVEQCSSPKIVFAPPKVDRGFYLGDGTCGGAGGGVAETTACPWRCKDAGNLDYAYCSLVNRTADFTSCVSCK